MWAKLFGRKRRASAPAAPTPAPRGSGGGAPGAAPRRGEARSATFAAIPDTFESLPEVTAALRRGGLTKCCLVVAVDFTQSNTWTGRRTFGGRCLHSLENGEVPNPYERALSTIGKTLAPLDADGLIAAYGFGDASTQDSAVFSFRPDGAPLRGFGELLTRYRALAPHVALAGPTSFAPAIRAAAAATASAGSEFTILLLLADGQVTRSADVPRGELSPQEAATAAALVEASRTVPLVVVMVGLGDGPWEPMRDFDDALPSRDWDNFQFVEVSALRGGGGAGGAPGAAWEAGFALACLQEVPAQHAACARLGLLGAGSRRGGRAVPRVRVLPPPHIEAAAPTPTPPQLHESYAAPYAHQQLPVQPPPMPRGRRASAPATAPESPRPAAAASCAVCFDAPRDAAFVPCGHAALCFACATRVMGASRRCPICRAVPQSHVRLYL